MKVLITGAGGQLGQAIGGTGGAECAPIAAKQGERQRLGQLDHGLADSGLAEIQPLGRGADLSRGHDGCEYLELANRKTHEVSFVRFCRTIISK